MSKDSFIIHGHLLKDAREDLNLDIDYVARYLTLNKTHIISMEENKKDGFVSTQIKLISVRKYAAFLELDIDTIIESEKNKMQSLNLPKPELEKNLADTNQLFLKKILLLSKIKLFFLWVKVHIKISHILFFIIFLFISNFLNGVYQKYSIAQKNSENQEIDLSKLDSLPINIRSDEIKSLQKKQEAPEALPTEIQRPQGQNKDNLIKMCGQIISEPISQISSSTYPLKPSDYFHIISKGVQSICILDNNGKDYRYSLTEGQKLTYRAGQAPFKILMDPTMSEIFYEGWLVKLTPEQRYIQLNPKTYD